MLITELSNAEIILTKGIPEPCCQLIWNVFFASRGRGINLSTHFPWIDTADDVFCLAIRDPRSAIVEKTIATTIIKSTKTKAGVRLGLVGLVCVAEEWRGKGLSSRLISDAIDFARKVDLDALVLWTQKPEVYTGHGFVPDNQELFGHVERVLSRRLNVKFTTKMWPELGELKSQRGLPAFAVGGRLISAESAEVIVLDSPNGVTVAEWHGSDTAVADLLENALPNQWRLNVNEKNSLVVELSKRNFKIDLKAGSLRLVKNLKNSSLLTLPEINLLDRI